MTGPPRFTRRKMALAAGALAVVGVGHARAQVLDPSCTSASLAVCSSSIRTAPS
jgi:hypothetical protein